MFTCSDTALFGSVFLPFVSLSTKVTTLVFYVGIFMHIFVPPRDKHVTKRYTGPRTLADSFVNHKECKTDMGPVILNASNVCMSCVLKKIARELAKYFSGSTRKRVSLDLQIKIFYRSDSDNYYAGTDFS
jgi:hypothetical protein